jgi:hypothetical protein
MNAAIFVLSYLAVGFFTALVASIVDRRRVRKKGDVDLLFKNTQQYVGFVAFAPLLLFVVGWLCILLLLAYPLGWGAKVLAENSVPMPRKGPKVGLGVTRWPLQEIDDDDSVN